MLIGPYYAPGLLLAIPSVPANVPRGYRNVGLEICCFLNISSILDKMTACPIADCAPATD